MAETVLGGTLSFLNELGMYDVILPFLLVFTIVFSILEKTKIFGVEEEGGKKYTRKNMNAIAAFVMAFFVIASSKLVALINTVTSQIFLVLLLVILFLMLAGVLHKEGEFSLTKGWTSFFMIAGFIVILLIFLNALGWLQWMYEFLSNYWNTEAVSAVILIVLIGLFVAWITKSPGPSKDKDKKED